MVSTETRTLSVLAVIGIISVFGIGFGISPVAAQEVGTTNETTDCNTVFEAHGSFHHGQSYVTVYDGDSTEVVENATVYMDSEKVGVTGENGTVDIPYPDSVDFELIVVHDGQASSLDMTLASWSYAQECNL